MNVTVLLLSLAAAATFAMSTVLKHRSAGAMPDVGGAGVSRIFGYVRAMTTHPLWLGGLVCDGAALGLQVFALSMGALSVVQPLLTLALVFAVLFTAWLSRRRPSKRVVGMSVALVAGLVLFLWASGAAASTGPEARGAAVPAVVVGVVSCVVVAACMIASRRVTPRTRALILGFAVAVVYACTAALIKTCTRILDRGVVELLTSWQLYTLIVAGALGVVLNQMAFQAGPITASLPMIAGIDPLLSVLIGRVVYNERLHSDPMSLLLEGIGLAVLLAAVAGLSHLSAQADAEVGPTNDTVVTGDDPADGGGAHAASDASR